MVKKIFGGICLFLCIGEIAAGIGQIIQGKTIDRIMGFILATLFFGVLAFFLLKPSKKKNSINSNLPSNEQNSLNPTPNQTSIQPPTTTPTIQHQEPSRQALNGMKKCTITSFENLMVNRILQLIQESYQLMCSTKNPETFLSRREFLLEKIQELKQFEIKGLYNHPKYTSSYYYELVQKNSDRDLFYCYKRYIDEAKTELSTQKGIDRRIDSFWETVQKHLGDSNTLEIKNNFLKIEEQNKLTEKELDGLNKKIDVEKNTTDEYIIGDNIISRVDGAPISDEEVQYLMELDKKRAFEIEANRPKRSDREEELSFQFFCKHLDESQRRCDVFLDLEQAAFKETNINKKIELLQKTIVAYEKAKQWHYKHSKGGAIYFQDYWECLHNSRNSCFGWDDSVREELEFQIEKRDTIIPWILENSKNGFMQPDIYKRFPDIGQSVLRNTIDELIAQNTGLAKTKKGRSYFITQKNNELSVSE